MNRIEIKPLSVNEVWQGRRFKSPKYKAYEQEVLYTLPAKWWVQAKSNDDLKGKKLMLFLKFGLSSKNADIDNPVKPLTDCLQKKYGFNDKQIYKLIVEKEIVKKKEEFIEFRITILAD